MEDRKPGRPIGRKLQLVLLIPVLLGIIICTVIVISIVFISQSGWVDDTKSYLISKEKEFMEVYSKSISSNLESVLGNQWYYLNFITNIYEKTKSGEIQSSNDIKSPKSINAYNVTSSKYPDTSQSEWLSGKGGKVSDFQDVLELTDPFMRIIQMASNISLQLGYVFNEGDKDLMYVYPVQNMSFINKQYNYESTCGKSSSEYSPTCSDTFALLKSKGLELIPYYEADRLFIMNNFSDGAGVSILDQKFLSESLADDDDYKTFACHYSGNWTLFVSDEEVTDYAGKGISVAMYKDSSSAAKDFKKKVVPMFSERNSSSLEKKIGSDITYIAFNRMNLSVYQKHEDSYVVGVSRTKSSVLKDWEGFIDRLLKLSIIQACIFGIFLIVSLVIAWFLSLLISNRVTRPIDTITSYLNKNDPPLYSIQQTFNSQINTILENLRKIETIEKFIDPSFLMHPLLKTRMHNLEVAAQLFKEVDNKRGLSICFNMIGNIMYYKRKYQEAEDYYRKSLKALEDLLIEIDQQEKEEGGLSENEKTKLNIKRDNFKDSWSDEKKFVEEGISEKLQQICMALMSRLRECQIESSLVEMRGKWKELIKLQTQILQYYEGSRSNYVKYLKLLLDLSESYQVLQYFHTSNELLDIVSEELWKIDVEKKSEVDIDVNRLRKIGISIIETETMAHFKVDNLTFEKDILMQRVLYRKSMNALDNNNYHKAAVELTSALVSVIQEYGKYYDPDVRKDCIRQLFNLFNRFGFGEMVPELKDLYQQLESPKKNIVMCLAYDLKNNPKINVQLTKICSTLFTNDSLRFGAISKNSRLKIMQLCERDFPGLDLENLMIQSKNAEDNESLIDLMHRGLEQFTFSTNEETLRNYLVVIYKKDSESFQVPPIGSLETLASKLSERVEILFISLGEAYSLDFEIFLENNRGEVLDLKDKDLINLEEKMRLTLRLND